MQHLIRTLLLSALNCVQWEWEWRGWAIFESECGWCFWRRKWEKASIWVERDVSKNAKSSININPPTVYQMKKNNPTEDGAGFLDFWLLTHGWHPPFYFSNLREKWHKRGRESWSERCSSLSVRLLCCCRILLGTFLLPRLTFIHPSSTSGEIQNKGGLNYEAYWKLIVRNRRLMLILTRIHTRIHMPRHRRVDPLPQTNKDPGSTATQKDGRKRVLNSLFVFYKRASLPSIFCIISYHWLRWILLQPTFVRHTKSRHYSTDTHMHWYTPTPHPPPTRRLSNLLLLCLVWINPSLLWSHEHTHWQ